MAFHQMTPQTFCHLVIFVHEHTMMHTQVNVLSYHRMTKALLPALRRAALMEGTPAPRVVFVASMMAGGLDLSDPEYKRRRYTR